MTQYSQRPYPDPNQPPMPGHVQADPYAAQGGVGKLKVCRAVAIAQMVIGAMVGLLAFCILATGAIAAGGALPVEEQGEFAELTSQLGDAAGLILVLTGICVGIPGVAQLVLGLFVWRGSKAGIIASMVVDGLFAAFMLLNLAAVLSTSSVRNPIAICTNVLMLAITVVLFVLLRMAYRESAGAAAAKAAYEAQWQQYYQQQYQYQAAMYQYQQAANAAAQQAPAQTDVTGDAAIRPEPPPVPDAKPEGQAGGNPPPPVPPAG